jgi:hypothetical protein
MEIAELSPRPLDPTVLEDLSRGARPAINALDVVRDAATVDAAQRL